MARSKKEAFISKVETASIGAASGTVGGLYFGDTPIVFKEPMIIIPAREQYMLNGTPSYMVYAHAGESLLPTGGNVDDTAQGVAEVAVLAVATSKRKKTNKYTRFNKKFSFRARKKNESSVAYLKSRNKAVSAAWRKQ